MTDMVWRGNQVADAAREAGRVGVRLAAEYIRSEAQQQAPIDTGMLRASATVKDVDSDKVSVGFYTPYAVRQHEELGYRHPKGGKAKYLEDPLRDGAQTVQGIVAAQVRRAMR